MATINMSGIPLVFKNIPAISVTAGTPQAVWTPATGKSFRLMGYNLSLSVAGSIIFKDGSAGEVLRTPTLIAAQPWQGRITVGNAGGLLSQATNNPLNLDVTASGSVSGYVYGIEQ
jgi:hypothetical protein